MGLAIGIDPAQWSLIECLCESARKRPESIMIPKAWPQPQISWSRLWIEVFFFGICFGTALSAIQKKQTTANVIPVFSGGCINRTGDTHRPGVMVIDWMLVWIRPKKTGIHNVKQLRLFFSCAVGATSSGQRPGRSIVFYFRTAAINNQKLKSCRHRHCEHLARL